MSRTIQEVTRTYFEFAEGTETYAKMSKEDKDFWEDYLVNIKVVEDENGSHSVELHYLLTNAASNRLTISASSSLVNL